MTITRDVYRRIKAVVAYLGPLPVLLQTCPDLFQAHPVTLQRISNIVSLSSVMLVFASLLLQLSHDSEVALQHSTVYDTIN